MIFDQMPPPGGVSVIVALMSPVRCRRDHSGRTAPSSSSRSQFTSNALSASSAPFGPPCISGAMPFMSCTCPGPAAKPTELEGSSFRMGAEGRAMVIRCARARTRLRERGDHPLPSPGIRGLSRKMRLKSPPNLIRHPETSRVHSNPHFRSLNQKSDPMGTLSVHRP